MGWQEKLASLHQGEFPAASLGSIRSLGTPFVPSEQQISIVSKLQSVSRQTPDEILAEFSLQSEKGVPDAEEDEKEKNMLQKLKLESYPKNKKTILFLKQALQKNILFSNLSQQQLELLVLRLRPQKISKNVTVYSKNETAKHFYLIQSGKLTSTNGKNVLNLSKGDCFGEVSLLTKTSQSSTIHTETIVGAWVCDKLSLRQILSFTDQNQIRTNLEKFNILGDTNIDSLFKQARPISLCKNTILFNEGTTGRVCYFLVDGSLISFKPDLAGVEFGKGDVVGFEALRDSTVICRSACELLAIPLNKLQYLQESFADLKLKRNMKRSMFFLDKNIDVKMKKIIKSSAELLTYESADVVYESSKSSPYFFIITDGFVKSGDRRLGPTNSFGYIHPKYQNIDGIFIADTPLKVYAISLAFISKKFQDMNATEKANITLKRSSHSSSSHQKLRDIQQYRRIYNKTFVPTLAKPSAELFAANTPQGLIGMGSFGSVYLIQNNETQELQALKTISMLKIVQHGNPANILNERNILEEMSHPFILGYIGSFKDQQNLYIVTELLSGGELYQRIEFYGPHDARATFIPKPGEYYFAMPKAEVVFYISSLTEALCYIHSKSIIFRDVKPENVMLDNLGFIKLIDFGFAKKVEGKTYTRCGTSEYFSPELLANRGYDWSNDLWALGVMTYELCTSQTPFVAEEHVDVFQNILYNQPDFEDMDPSVSDFIAKLLNKNPAKRLGVNSEQNLKNHVFFKSVDWMKLVEKKIAPPFVPASQLPEVKPKAEFKANTEEMEEFMGSERQLKPSDYEGWYLEF